MYWVLSSDTHNSMGAISFCERTRLNAYVTLQIQKPSQMMSSICVTFHQKYLYCSFVFSCFLDCILVCLHTQRTGIMTNTAYTSALSTWPSLTEMYNLCWWRTQICIRDQTETTLSDWWPWPSHKKNLRPNPWNNNRKPLFYRLS